MDMLLACYDALAEDIRLAGKSAGKGDVAGRCRYSEHALLLIDIWRVGYLYSMNPNLPQAWRVSIAIFVLKLFACSSVLSLTSLSILHLLSAKPEQHGKRSRV